MYSAKKKKGKEKMHIHYLYENTNLAENSLIYRETRVFDRNKYRANKKNELFSRTIYTL